MRYDDSYLSSQGGEDYKHGSSILVRFFMLILVIAILFGAAYIGLHGAGMIK